MDIALAMDAATAHHREDRLGEAAAIYTAVLAHDPHHANALHHLGLLLYQNNQFADATPLLQRATVADPNSPRNFYTLALSLIASGEVTGAIGALRKAVEIKPDWPDALFGLASASEQAGDFDGAIEFYQRATRVKPDYVDAWINMGNSLQAMHRFPESVDAYRSALGYTPDNPNIYSNLGTALRAAGDHDAAIQQFQKAIDIDPKSFLAIYNLGVTYIETGELDEAHAVLQQTISLNPNFAEAWLSLGNVFTRQRKIVDATAAFQSAVRLRPTYVQAWHNLGNAEQAGGNFKSAVEAYRQAIALEPGFLDSHNNLGCLFKSLGRLDEAERHLRTALSILPNYHVALCNLGNVLKDAGQIEEAIDLFRKAMEACPTDELTHSNLAYSMHFDPRWSAEDILHENRRWSRSHAASLLPAKRTFSNDRDLERRLRVGYVGVDFREHCQSFFTSPLFRNHDRSAFEIICYADVSKPDAVTENLKSTVDLWRDIGGQSDQQVAEQISDDRIDILVDLTMHMSRGRPLVMARKPAPVQVAWLAYPGTTGIAGIDYRLTDPYLDPTGVGDAFYSERSWRLPDTFWCYDPLTDQPESGPLPADANGFITFGCLNNFCKVTQPTLELWACVLQRVSRSRLLLLAGEGSHRQRMIDFFAAKNVEADRIHFERFQPRDQYLRLYQQIDLGLDTVPYNGHTTSLDSLWMGIPIVTRVGETAVGRAGFSQLSNLNLTALAGSTDEAFVTIATELAGDLERLRALRSTLRKRLQASPLMNYARFTKGIELFYRQAWREWCSSIGAS